MRPIVHFTGEKGWINDPHGVTFHDGRYHLFHQAHPGSLDWDLGIEWGHATSPDLVTWAGGPAALTPGDGDDGCWSGCLATDEAGEPVIFYTAVAQGAQDLATVRTATALDPDWNTWAKGEVVAAAPDGALVYRDPMITRGADGWRMAVGGGLDDGSPCVFGYRSSDLRTWERLGVVASGGAEMPFPAGQAWECPQVLEIEGRTVLVVSTWSDGVTGEVLAGVGDLVGDEIVVEYWQQLGVGGGPYAPTAFVDADGEPCLLFWLREIVDPDGGWAGALSLPYRLGVEDCRLTLAPHPTVVAAFAGRPQVLGLTWEPPGPSELEVFGAGGERVILLDRQDVTLTIRAGGRELVVPLVRADLPITLAVDGPILEVCTGTTLIAWQVPAADLVRPSRGDVRVW